MIGPAREGDKGAPAADLLESIGDTSWAARGQAIRGVLAESGDDLVPALLAIVQEQHRDLSRLNSALQILARSQVDVVPKLVQLLVHADREVRTYAALALGERGDPRAIPSLLSAVDDTDANVRMHAIEAVGKLRAAEAVDRLTALVEAMDFELAFPALDALIAIGDERIAHRLVPLLRNNLVKVLVIEALGALGDEEVIKPLLDRLADPDVSPSEVAAALSRLHLRYVDRYGDGTTVPRVVRSLASAANVQSLIAAVSQSAGTGLTCVARVLGWLPGPEVDAELVNLLERPPVDDEVVASLVKRGPGILPLLLQRLATSKEESRKTIVEILKQIGDRAAAPALLDLLTASDDEDLLVRTVGALARLGAPAAYEALKPLLGHSSSRVRQAAVAAISSLGHDSTAADVQASLADASPLVRESAVRLAAYLGLPACRNSILASLQDPDERVRRVAIECLPMFDDDQIHAYLANALASDTPAVRAAAVGALAKTEDPPAARELLAKSLDDTDVWVRYFAVRSLAVIGQQQAVSESLVRLARHDVAPQVRVAAIDALTGCGPEVIPVLDELSSGPSQELAKAAAAALAVMTADEQAQDARSADGSCRSRPRGGVDKTGALAHGSVALLCQRALGGDAREAAEAIDALGKSGRIEAAEALLEIARVPTRRDSAVIALAQIGGGAVPALASGLHDSDVNLRRAVVEALARIRSGEALEALESALEDGEPSVRQAALAALAHLRKVHRPT